MKVGSPCPHQRSNETHPPFTITPLHTQTPRSATNVFITHPCYFNQSLLLMEHNSYASLISFLSFFLSSFHKLRLSNQRITTDKNTNPVTNTMQNRTVMRARTSYVLQGVSSLVDSQYIDASYRMSIYRLNIRLRAHSTTRIINLCSHICLVSWARFRHRIHSHIILRLPPS